MSEKKQGPIGRIKAKRRDGTEFDITTHDGQQVTNQRKEVAVIWENQFGGFTVRFSPELEAALQKLLGGECYYDVYVERTMAAKEKDGKGSAKGGKRSHDAPVNF